MTLVDTLVELVNIPSETGSEGRIATALAERLLPVWGMDGVQRLGNSLIVGRRTGRPLISLYGHTDTVPEQDNGTARIDSGMVYGLGASDMKAGLAVMVHLLESDEIRNGPFDVVGVFYDKEEGPMDDNGLEVVLDVADWLESSEFAVVLEPTDLRLELGCNGAINAKVTFVGESAHSARPWLGRNAITKAGAWLAAMDEREPEVVDVSGLDYREVFSVTQAEGGIANNIVPPMFELNLNYRFPPIYDLAEAENRLREAAADADRVEIVDSAPAATFDDSNPFLGRLERLTRADRAAKQGWTDVARLMARGIGAVNYGPGVVAQAHQAGEHVPIENLERCYESMRLLLSS